MRVHWPVLRLRSTRGHITTTLTCDPVRFPSEFFAITASCCDPSQGEALKITMTFKSNKAVGRAVWDLKYMVDMASKRKLIGLCPSLLPFPCNVAAHNQMS